jgi:hypothetical protein
MNLFLGGERLRRRRDRERQPLPVVVDRLTGALFQLSKQRSKAAFFARAAAELLGLSEQDSDQSGNANT